MVLNVHKTLLLPCMLMLLSHAAHGEESVDVIPGGAKMKRTASDCRIDICFAIDGSDNMAPWQFRHQRTFVEKVVRRISQDNRIRAAAVQYGVINNVISPLTTDIPKFLREVQHSTFIDSSLSSVGSGVVYCDGQLREIPGRRARMVVLGTGNSEIGGSPAVRADNFRSEGGKVFAVSIGDSNIAGLIGIAGGRRNVFYLRPRSRVNDLIDAFVPVICD